MQGGPRLVRLVDTVKAALIPCRAYAGGQLHCGAAQLLRLLTAERRLPVRGAERNTTACSFTRP